jgi:hypothetical protein
LSRIAVHVRARTGRVVPTLHDTLLRGLVPGGADDVPDGGVVAVGAGSVVDVPLSGVPDGDYGAVVSADVPVLAAGLVGRAAVGALAAGTGTDPTGKAPPAEFGWTTAGKALNVGTLLALPSPGAVSTVVTLTAPGQAGRVEGHAIDEHGRIGPTHLFDVAAGTTTTINVTPRSSGVLLAPAGGAKVVAAAVAQAADPAGTMLSVLPVTPLPGALRTAVGRVGDLGLGLAAGAQPSP